VEVKGKVARQKTQDPKPKTAWRVEGIGKGIKRQKYDAKIKKGGFLAGK
jgi:hypothetical protein